MKNRRQMLALGLVLISAAGCGGDSFATLFHESIATYNEMADNMVKVCDEESAAAFSKKRMDKISKRWQGITARAQTYLKLNDADTNPKVKFELANAFIDYCEEYVGVMDRLKDEQHRLNQIRIKIFQERYGAEFSKTGDLNIECPNITMVMNAPKNLEFKSLLPDNPFDVTIVMTKLGGALQPAQEGGAAPQLPPWFPSNLKAPPAP